MQPAPLTGTATLLELDLYSSTYDAARAPHGDSNTKVFFKKRIIHTDAARSPHGDSNTSAVSVLQVMTDAARAPHGDEKKGDKKQLCFLSPFLYKRLFPHLTLPYR